MATLYYVVKIFLKHSLGWQHVIALLHSRSYLFLSVDYILLGHKATTSMKLEPQARRTCN